VNYSKQDAPLPFITARPFTFPVPPRSTWSRPVPAFGAAAGHMWGTWLALRSNLNEHRANHSAIDTET
jgi:hypothetical protein